MKKISITTFVLFCISTFPLFAQWGNIGDRIADGLSNKAQQKIESEINNAADKTYEKTKSKTKESVKNSGNNKNSPSSKNSSNSNDDNGNNGNSSSKNSSSNSSSNSSLKAYGKFDFVQGEKVIAMEDFSQDAIGDFPSNWNTNGSGEIVTIDGQQGKWLKIGPESIIYPEFVTNLPENFTVEFMVASSQPFSYYSSFFNFFFAPLLTPTKNYIQWKQYGGNKKNGVALGIHPQSAGNGSQGMKNILTFDESGAELVKNDADFEEFNDNYKNVVKVSIWRQKTRLRVYINEVKIWDIPKAFSPTAKYNFLGFRVDGLEKDDAYFLSNLRVAVGAPDTRHKFLDLGKYTTTGIKFDVNSDKIKGESYGTLKDFATILTENPSVKVKIVGHTDSDGDDASNMTLSKKRADAVKAALNKEFGIDNNRMETEGKGETQPAEPNSSAEGKANNRRVEFIKL